MSVNSIKIGNSSPTAYKNYLKEQAEILAEYYGRDMEGIAFARVEGRAADYLNVENGVTDEQWSEIHAGRWNGKQLCQMGAQPVWAKHADGKIVRDERGQKVAVKDEAGKMITVPYRTSWIDMTAAAPKSVVEYMIATTPEVRKQMIAEWDAAVSEGIKAVEERAYLVRKTISKTYVEGTKQQGSATERVRGAHIIAFPTTQLTARHTEETIERGSPPDPHLHTHIPIATMAFLPDETHPDGMRPLTIDHKAVKNFEEEANAIIMGDYARRLEAMGIELDYDEFETSRRGTVGWEIEGISREARRHHSTNTTRREAIEREFEYKYDRPATRQEVEELMRKSRVSKSKTPLDKQADTRGVWPEWGADLEAHGIEVEHRVPGAPKERDSLQKRQKELYDRLMGPKGLCKASAEFSGDSILTSMELAAVGLGFTQDEIKAMEPGIRRELVLQRPANDERFTLYTTKVELAKEARIERGIRFIASQQVPAPTDAELAAAMEAQDHELDPKQKEAALASTTQKWTFVEGVAGSGKSTTMKAARQALVDARLIDRTIVVSTAAATAQRSGITIGADYFGSVESIERAMITGKLTPSDRNLWIIDEAAMMDNDHIDRLLMAARGQGRFVSVGDQAQLSPIGAAGWYSMAIDEHGSVLLDKSHRFTGPQKEEDVRDYTLLRNGNIGDATTAVNNLAARGRIHESEDRDDRMKRVFNDYVKFRNEDPSLSVDDIRMIIETSNADVDEANRFIQFDQKRRGELKGKGFRVHDEEQNRQWTLHENESVIFLRSYVHDEKSRAIRNGTKARILKIDEKAGEAIVRLEDQQEARVKLNEFEKKQPMAPAGAQHANKIQGDEVEITQVLPGTEQTANANSDYSQNTRAKRESHMYTDRQTHGDRPNETLAEMYAVRVEKTNAIKHRRGRADDIGLDTPYEKTTAGRDVPHEKSADERRAEPYVQEQGPYVHEQSKDRDLQRQKSPVATMERTSSVVEKEEVPQVEEPQKQQPAEPEAERQQDQGSLRERFSHLRDRGRDRGRSAERDEQRSPVEREFTHLRDRGPDRGLDRGL